MPEKAEPKISVSEAVLIGLFLAILDAIDLIPVAGDLTDIAAAPLVLYYFMKHINGTAYIISWFLDLIPVVQEIPSRSIAWWGMVIFERVAPAKLERGVEEVGELEEGGEGGEALEGGEGLEAGASEGAEASKNAEQGISSAEEAQGGAEVEGTEGEASAEGRGGEAVEQDSGGETETRAEEEGGGTENPEGKGASGEEGEGGAESISDTESERDPIDVEREKLLEGSGDDTPSTGSDEDDEEESESEESTPNPAGNTIGIDSSKKWQRNQQNTKPADQPTSAYDTKPKEKAA